MESTTCVLLSITNKERRHAFVEQKESAVARTTCQMAALFPLRQKLMEAREPPQKARAGAAAARERINDKAAPPVAPRTIGEAPSESRSPWATTPLLQMIAAVQIIKILVQNSMTMVTGTILKNMRQTPKQLISQLPNVCIST